MQAYEGTRVCIYLGGGGVLHCVCVCVSVFFFSFALDITNYDGRVCISRS